MTAVGTPAVGTPAVRKRRIQERTEVARNSLISAAIPMFAEQGFDAISVRDIENAADVKRGMLAYHFGKKEDLWKIVADTIFESLATKLTQRLELLKELSEREGIAFLIRFHVHYYAEHPELSRLMSQEARQKTWRIKYLVEKHKLPSVRRMEKYISEGLGLTKLEYAHWYYIMVSASATMFSFEHECQELFGFNPREKDAVERHAEMIVARMLPPQ